MVHGKPSSSLCGHTDISTRYGDVSMSNEVVYSLMALLLAMMSAFISHCITEKYMQVQAVKRGFGIWKVDVEGRAVFKWKGEE